MHAPALLTQPEHSATLFIDNSVPIPADGPTAEPDEFAPSLHLKRQVSGGRMRSQTGKICLTLLSSSMAEHSAVNRRVVGSSPT